MLSTEEFELLKIEQYCDNTACNCYNKKGLSNIKINSQKKRQVYCNVCKNLWVITKGTIFFGLRTPIDKIVDTLLLLVRGMGLRNTSRQSGVTIDAIHNWLLKASEHSKEFTVYLQDNMQLEQVQIDEFWSYVLKKRKL